jgi:hypothetical protein
VHTNVHIIAQSDENYVADAVSAIVKFKSVSNHECQSYRFFRGSDLRIEATQFNLSAENSRIFTKMFTPSMIADIVTVAKPVVDCNPGVMVVTPDLSS